MQSINPPTKQPALPQNEKTTIKRSGAVHELSLKGERLAVERSFIVLSFEFKVVIFFCYFFIKKSKNRNSKTTVIHNKKIENSIISTCK
jgi:hypothetical protein